MEKRYIGIDIGGTNIAIGIILSNGEILDKIVIPTNVGRDYRLIVEDIAGAVNKLLDGLKIGAEDISSIGIGVPGNVNNNSGIVRLAVNMNWKDVPLAEELNKYFSVPVLLGNDADCAALAETLGGAAKGYSSAIMITLGTGVGGGIIINKRIFSGCTGDGTEPGHFPFMFNGELCGCGKRGCFEAYAAAPALIRQTKNAMLENNDSLLWTVCGGKLECVDGSTPFKAAKAGDDTALKVIDKYTTYVASGIGGLISILRPEVIIIGGGIGNEGDYLIDILNEKIPDHCYGSEALIPPKAIKSVLGNDAGIIGAGLLGKTM